MRQPVFLLIFGEITPKTFAQLRDKAQAEGVFRIPV